MLQQPKSRLETLSWNLRVGAHQARRLGLWALQSARFPALQQAGPGDYTHLHGRKSIPLRRTDEDAHPLLEQGKITNLRLAAVAFDGLALGPGRPLSFWKTLGRMSARGGFVHGMELRAGCLVPALGGGICLLSNALFDMGARLGWQVLERHGHTLEAVPSWNRPWGMDATVLWPYVDLRLEPRWDCRLSLRVRNEVLLLEVWGREPFPERVELESRREVVQGDLRCNEVWRRRWGAGGEWLGEERIARNSKSASALRSVGPTARGRRGDRSLSGGARTLRRTSGQEDSSVGPATAAGPARRSRRGRPDAPGQRVPSPLPGSSALAGPAGAGTGSGR